MAMIPHLIKIINVCNFGKTVNRYNNFKDRLGSLHNNM